MRAAIAALLLALLPSLAGAQVPERAHQYQRELIRNARYVWGLDAPIAVFAAQIHQESGWRPEVSSKYADGLAQFTPATATWIGGVYSDVGKADPFNPSWALRALVRYDKHLYDRNQAATECDRWAFTLSAYNGGNGWVNRDRRLAAAAGADPMRWWGHVERYSGRAQWAIKENRGYPQRILLVLQPRYLGWGPAIDCRCAQ